METLSHAIARLEAAGYREGFTPTRDGLLASRVGRHYAPETLILDSVERFEGPTDPADASVLFALRAPDGVRGTWAIAYGPARDPLEAAVAERLRPKR
jgi:hypothetical protein